MYSWLFYFLFKKPFQMAQVKETSLPGVLEIFPTVFKDQRGYFFESYREDWLHPYGVNHGWVQDNQSFSQKGTVRGLHYQRAPHAQAKLVRVIQGKVLDVVVDLRKGSSSFGQSLTVTLDTERNNLLYIPAGFAHGFSVLEDAIFVYKCSAYYHKPAEGGICWNDPQLAIDWMLREPIISEKDRVWPTLQEFKELSEGGLLNGTF